MAALSDLQTEIVAVRARRGFTTDPVKLVVLLTEEIGEIAREVKKSWSPNYEGFDADRLAPELADAFSLLSALASDAGIDLAAAVEQKFLVQDEARPWATSRDLPDHDELSGPDEP